VKLAINGKPQETHMTPEPTTKLSLQVGAKVAILQHKHLKCAAHGFVQFINGAYISVRAEDVEPVESDACEHTFELYPNELRVVANYQHQRFKLGAVVRIKQIEWLNVAPKTHGVVIGVEAERILIQPVGAHKSAIISLRPEALELEGNENNQSAQALAQQTSILAVLAALGSTTISQLTSLLATQVGLGSRAELEQQLAVLANQGQIALSETRATVRQSAGLAPSVPKLNQDGLKEAIERLEKAKESLAEAVRQATLALTL
jgi:hypothetical protein